MQRNPEPCCGDAHSSQIEFSLDGPRINPKVEGKDFASRDESEMAMLGKMQQLKRNFGFWSIVGFSCTIMITWEGLLCVFGYGLGNGGPAGLFYGFLFCWLGYFSVVASMAELASMAPTSGGQYHWTYILAPPAWKVFFSYITGWQSVIAWQATVASGSFLTGTILQGLLALNYPNYVFERYHGTLLFYAAMLVALIFNTVLASQLPNVERTLLVLHICGFLAILIPLTVLAPHGSAHAVFTSFSNVGRFETQGLSFFVGIITPVYSFVGADGCVHMCEEIKGASTVVPQGLMISIVLNGLLGVAMLLAFLFCMGNARDALDTPTKFPFIEIFAQATGSSAGATGMTTIILCMLFAASITVLTAASRVTWAFARDRGLPFSGILSRVEHRTKIPLYSIGLSTILSLLLALINIGSTEAFNAIVSLVIAGFLGSCILPIGLLLLKRLRGDDIAFGPWKLGKLGIVANGFALTWTVIALFFSFWPGAINPKAQTMNWACLLYGATMIFGVVFYLLHGRHQYKGPVMETSVVEQVHGA